MHVSQWVGAGRLRMIIEEISRSSDDTPPPPPPTRTRCWLQESLCAYEPRRMRVFYVCAYKYVTACLCTNVYILDSMCVCAGA